MYAFCVKNIFLRIYKLFGTLLHCTSALQPTSTGFLKIDALQDVLFTFYVEIVSIILERPWAVAQSV